MVNVIAYMSKNGLAWKADNVYAVAKGVGVWNLNVIAYYLNFHQPKEIIHEN